MLYFAELVVPARCVVPGNPAFFRLAEGSRLNRCWNVHLGQSKRITERALKRAMAGLLAGWVLFAAILSSSPSLHQRFHHDSSTSSQGCVLCLLATGQIDAPASAPVLTAPVRSTLDPRSRREFLVLVGFTYLASSSRAPPALAALHLAVA